MNNKELWAKLKKYQLREVEIDFDFHLYEPDVMDAERIDEEVRIIEIPHTKVEFGIEDDLDNKDKVNIVFGFGGLTLDKKDFVRAVEDWKTRGEYLKVLGKK